jgi:CheY-like chemotaxis protein
MKLKNMTGKHVLIIEDDADISDVLDTLLSDDGYQVTAITETGDIIKTVMELKPDLIITDYILAGINGGEYCSQIKRDKRTGHIPVIILSGYGRVLDSLGHYGADRIVDKPFNNDKLCDIVSELVGAAND